MEVKLTLTEDEVHYILHGVDLNHGLDMFYRGKRYKVASDILIKVKEAIIEAEKEKETSKSRGAYPF